MTRRQIHVGLLVLGATWAFAAILDILLPWLNRSDVFLLGMVTVALGLHGLWKTDPR